MTDSYKILKALRDPWDRRNCMIDICYSLQETGPIENTFVYLDSLYSEIEKKPKFGTKLFRVLGMIGSQSLYDIAMDTYKDFDDKVKPRALSNFIRGVSSSGLYHRAFTYIPKYASRENELELYNEILHSEVQRILNDKKNKNGIPGEKSWELYEKSIYGESIPENYEFEGDHFDMFAD